MPVYPGAHNRPSHALSEGALHSEQKQAVARGLCPRTPRI
jgi:hypothetical protein